MEYDMKNLALDCTQLYQQAEQHFREGSREIGIALFVEGERRLADVPDPVMFLALYSRADRMALKYLLPRV
jgi:hypothetical protein